MKIVYKNITFNLIVQDAGSYIGLGKEGEMVGLTLLDIPSKHVVGMKRDGYYVEHEHNGKLYNLLPHMYPEDYENDECTKLIYINHELIDSYNTDLHIVYFKWMLEHPRKKFEVYIMCENAYWIFHDIAHSDDVQGPEVCCLSAELENRRLQEGIDLMVESGYEPKFTDREYDRITDSFYNRWKVGLDPCIFSKYIEEEEYEYE